jgi:hypothetical protein
MLSATSAAAILSLLEKYREIKRLREEHVHGEPADPRPRLRALAARFPGALRELDELPMEEIDARLAMLVGASERAEPVPAWVALQLAYHGWMRAALRIKRIARGRGADHAVAVLAELPQRYRPEPHDPPLASFDLAAVSAILEPADGRLNPWVYARVAAFAGVEPDAVRRALFLR